MHYGPVHKTAKLELSRVSQQPEEDQTGTNSSLVGVCKPVSPSMKLNLSLSRFPPDYRREAFIIGKIFLPKSRGLNLSHVWWVCMCVCTHVHRSSCVCVCVFVDQPQEPFVLLCFEKLSQVWTWSIKLGCLGSHGDPSFCPQPPLYPPPGYI